jgi:TusA-related sulfurtransferase
MVPSAKLAWFLVEHLYRVGRNPSFTQGWVQGMNKTAKIDLHSIPWPVNLLKSHQYTTEMQPGDVIVISVKDEAVKNSLVLLLNAMPGLSFDVSAKGPGFEIKVTKIRSRNSTGENHLARGK